MLFSGIDLHKRTIAIQTLDTDGEIVRETRLPARREALSAYFATLTGPHQAVVECMGMWYWVRDLLVPQGIDLKLGHARYLKGSATPRCGRRGGCCHTRTAPSSRAHPGDAHDQSSSAFPDIRAEYQRRDRRKGKPIARALTAKELASIVSQPRYGFLKALELVHAEFGCDQSAA